MTMPYRDSVKPGSRRWLPHPLLSIFLLLVWLLLVNSVSVGQILLGALLGFAIPLLTRRFWINPPHVKRPLKLILFLLQVLVDIILANLQVAKLILSPVKNLRPAFIDVPIELNDDLALIMLASIVSLTPGSVSADISDDRKTLLVHCLNVTDPQQVIASIKQDYEQPLKDIFAC